MQGSAGPTVAAAAESRRRCPRRCRVEDRVPALTWPSVPVYRLLTLLLLSLSLGCALAQPQATSPAAAQVSLLVSQGVDRARAGLFAQATGLFQQALALDPGNHDARYNLALTYYNTGDYRNAVTHFQRVLDREPYALDARKGLGLTLLALHRYPEAAAAFRVAVDAVPRDVSALAGLGRAYMGAGNPRKALEPLRLAVQLSPQDAALAFELGKAAGAVGNYTEAFRWLTQALSLKPDSAAAATEMARLQLVTKQPLQAVQTLMPFSSLNPPDRGVLTTLAAAFDALNLSQEALQTRERLALSLPPAEALRVRLQIGDAYLSKAGFEAALQQFKLASELAPTSGEPYAGLARAYEGLGRRPEAITNWRRAAGLAPDKSEYWLALAEALKQSRDLTGALVALDRGLDSHPVEVKLLQRAAAYARQVPDLSRAENYLRRILALSPRDFTARMAVVDILVERGRKDRALIEAGEALRAPNAPADAYLKVAFLAEDLGNLDLAISTWRDLLKRGNQNETAVAQELGRLLVKAGRAPEAIELYRSLLGGPKPSPRLTLGLATAYQALGQDTEAVSTLTALLSREPKLIEARVALAESLSYLDRHAEAWQQIEQVALAGPMTDAACRTLALVGVRGGRTEQAITLLERLLPGSVPEDTATTLLVDLCGRLHREAEGGRRLLVLFDQHPDHPILGLKAAELLAQAGGAENLADADQLLRGLSQRTQLRETALRRLVRLYLPSANPERALDPLGRLLEPVTSTAGIVALLAEMQVRPDLVREQQQTLLALSEAETGSPAFWVAAAQLSQIMQRTGVEAVRLQALSRQHPEDLGIATGIATLALLQGQPQVAEEALARIPDERRDDRVLLYTLAQAQVALGKPEAAMHSLRRAIQVSKGGLADDHVLLAGLLRDARKPEDALWHLTVALRREPGHAPAREAFKQMIAADLLPPATVLQALKEVYFEQPEAAVVYDLLAALQERPDARQLCDEWLKQHPQPLH
jgi:tetratricopeptide (TPR) repeat protein